MRRRSRLTVTIVLASLMFLTGYLVATSTSSPSSTGVAGAASDAIGPNAPFYLDIGASSSLGMQPTGIPSRNGQLTTYGYANDLVSFETKNNVDFVLQHDGCPGETAESMIETASHKCNTPAPQLTKAVNFLTANADQPGLVTLDIGFNDVRTCLNEGTVNEACVNKGLANIQEDLPKVLRVLRDAAGPQVTFVGLGYYDPFLADYVIGLGGVAVAQATLEAVDRLNEALERIYSAGGAKYADVAAGFATSDVAPDTIANVGSVPVNVAEVCLLTWMCQPAPFGPDDHPDNAGYMVIAEAIADVLPGAWRDDPVK